MVGTFVEEQNVLNVQTNQKIEAVENSLNRKLDNMHSEISRLSNQQLQDSEKGKVPSKSQKGMHEIGSTNDANVRIDEVKAVVTLRSGKELRPTVPAPAKSAPTVADPPQEEQSANRKEVKNNVPPLFPQALQKKKNSVNQT